jgi:hypothetical protein
MSPDGGSLQLAVHVEENWQANESDGERLVPSIFIATANACID